MSEKPIKMLALSLTGQCNFACVYCYAADHNKDVMCFGTAQKAIDLAARSGEKFILQLTGGEPLLNFACIRQILIYIKEQKIRAVAQIQTNGSLLTQGIADFLNNYGCAIGISLDGRPDANDNLRKLPDGKGATNHILKGFEVLRQNRLGCGITCVVTKTNVQQLSGIIDMAYYLGNVRRIGFDLLRGQGRGTDLQQPDEIEVGKAMQEVYEKAQTLSQLTGTKIKLSQLERVKMLADNATSCFGHCYAMNGEAAFVDAKGSIYACSSLIGDMEYYLGHVDTGICLEKQQQIIARIKQSMYFCFSCKDFSLCGGGCYARWLGSNASGPYQVECAFKKISIKYLKMQLSCH